MITDLEELGALLDARRRTLFRLETLDVYEVASDGSDYRRYLDGEPEPEWQRKQPWMDELRAERDSGYYRHRVHVLRTPLGPYLRYECEWGYAYNVQVGEDIRILDLAETPEPPGLVDHDFWLVDGDLVVLMHYDDAGQFLGGEALPPIETPRYVAARDAAWVAATPFELWWAARPQYHRCAGSVG
ncbi:MAG: DUF6879 family protein [Pseudonocardiaceae bacterium]